MKKIVSVLGIFLLPIILFIIIIAGSPDENTTTDFSPQTEQEKVAYQVYQFVLKNGGTREFACAWLGNMEHESNLIPSRIQSDLPFLEATAYNPSLGGYALGLAQWDGSRRVNMLTIAKEKNVDWKNIEFQLGFAWNDDGSDSALLKKLSTSTDINQTAIDILIQWERAGIKFDPIEQANRKTSANNWYNRLSKGGQGAGSANIGGGTIDILENKMGQEVYNGQCYGLVSFYIDSFETGICMLAGSPRSNVVLGGISSSADFVSAFAIGDVYKWEENGFEVIQNPSFSEIKAGDVINFGMGNYASTAYGHTAIVSSVGENNQFILYEQNAEQGQICAKYTRTWGAEYTNVVSVVRKK